MILIDCLTGVFFAILSLFNRIRLRWHLHQLKSIKKRNLINLFGGYVLSPEEKCLQYVCSQVCSVARVAIWPITFCVSMCGDHRESRTYRKQNTSAKTREVRLIDMNKLGAQPPNYVHLAMSDNTFENRLVKQAAVFIYGTGFCIVFFYTQVYLLARFDWVTLAFALVFVVVCTFGPILSETYGLAVSLLVVPVSVTATVRACIYAVILLELQVIAWGNINTNLDNTLDGITCDKRVIAEFWNKIDFRFEGGAGDKLETGRIQVNLNPESNAWFTILSKVQSMQYTFKQIYRKIVFLLNGLVDLSATVSIWVRRLVSPNLSDLSFDIFNMSIRVPLQVLGQLVERLLAIIERHNPISVATRALTKTGNLIVSTFKDAFSVQYHKNYQFKVNSSNNVSLSVIVASVKSELLRKHTYLTTVQRVLVWLVGLYVVQAFVRIFAGAIWYLVLYLHVSSYDNHYITDEFVQLDQRKQRQSAVDTLFPLYLFEVSMYVRRNGLALSGFELARLAYAVHTDLCLALYVAVLFALDYGAFGLCGTVRHWTLNIAHKLNQAQQSFVRCSVPYFERYLSQEQNFATDLQALGEQVRKCAPVQVAPEYDMYGKCVHLMLLVVVVGLVEPYLLRTRSVVCEQLFPQRVSPRTHFLYSFIVYTRMAVKTLVQTFNPALKQVLFTKIGPTNTPNMSIGSQVTEPLKPFCLYRFWPFSALAQLIGIIEAPNQCVKCFKQIYSKSLNTFKCPNLKCTSFYCVNCFSQLKKRCLACNTAVCIDSAHESVSEEIDSSSDEL